jgi:hypothetical protein
MLTGGRARRLAYRIIGHSPAELQRVEHLVMCSWCHELNDLNQDLTHCLFCGHRTDVPRSQCDCPRCGRKPDDVGEYSVAQVDDWLARR